MIQKELRKPNKPSQRQPNEIRTRLFICVPAGFACVGADWIGGVVIVSKYGNKKVYIDNMTFDSILEGERYKELKILLDAGHIRSLECQPCYILLDAFRDNTGKKHRAIKYYADFIYYDYDRKAVVVEDTKGYKTPVFRMKEKLFRSRYPDVIFEVG